MKSLMSLVGSVLRDIEDLSAASTTDDLKTIVRRVEQEGLSFLTITLANFGKDFQKSLDRGFVAPSDYAGFSRSGALPRFLGGLLGLVFDKQSGVLLDQPSIPSIAGIHQLTSMFSKMRVDCTPSRERKAFADWIKCEQDIKVHDSTFQGDLRHEFSVVSSVLFGDIFSYLDLSIQNDDILPKHGPGATAEKLSSNKKYTSMRWYTRLDEVFPHIKWMYPNYLAALDEPFGSVDILEPGAEIPVRVISVPKTLKSPRIIAIEPAHMQYMQQAILSSMVPRIESDHLVGSMIGFTDQEPNRLLAQRGSLYGDLATLDLSEASDRVSNQHVLEMMRPWPTLSSAVQATRSRKADVPGFGVVRLSKFASMGSALCFPVEAMVFLTIVFMGIGRKLSTPVTRKLVSQFIGRVRVYGDDIIVPVEYAETVAKTLDLLGYKVNANKSFWTGKFRESCGGDYYDGEWITPIRLRVVVPQQLQQIDEVVSFSAFRNQLYKAGYWKTVRWCDSHLDSILGGIYPAVEDTSDAIGRHTYLPVEGERMCPSLQRPMVRAYKKRDKLRADKLEGYGALMKFFLKSGDDPIQGEHLMFAGRPLTSRLIKGWTYTY